MSISRKSRTLRAAFTVSVAWAAATSALPQSGGPSGVDAARAHATPYADPNYYTQPAVVDIYQDIFLGRPTSQTNPAYYTGDAGPAYAAERQTVACYAGTCSPVPPRRAQICASAYNGAFLKIGVGDTFYIGKLGIDGSPAGNTPDATKARTHAVVSIAPGTGAASCALGTWVLSVYPWIDYVAEGVTNGASLSPVWRDALHPTNGTAYLIGYKLGSDTRDTWGAQRRNPISNPGFQGDANGIVQGWTLTPGTINSYPYDLGNGPTKPSSGAVCNSGEGVGYTSGTPGHDCVAPSAAQDAEIIQTTPVAVSAGGRYILSGLISTNSAAAYYGLADDRDGNGTWTLSPDLRVTLTDPQVKTSMNRVPRWFSSVVTIPAGVSAVKFLYHAASSTDWLDYVSIRKQMGLGDSMVTPNYLMNDPGSRNIVFMGDSWFDPEESTPYPDYFKQGLLDAFAARGISIPAGRVVFTGHGGDLTINILMRLPSVLATYHPLYIVLDGGINDAYQEPVAEDTMANLKEIARLCVQAGAIPIFVSPPPAVRLNGTQVFGDGSTFAVLHTLRESLRNWAFALDGDGCGTPDGVLFSTCGTGSCTRAAATCVSGVPQACVPGVPQAEVCNGLDDDCNGVIDDGGAANGNDNSACTQNDTCQAGACVGVPLPVPLEVGNGLRISRAAGNRILTWSLAINATSSDLLRGTIIGLPVGPGTVDETCLGNVTTTMFTDNTAPPVNGGFWYLVRGANACPTKGPWGFRGDHGLQGAARASTTCP